MVYHDLMPFFRGRDPSISFLLHFKDISAESFPFLSRITIKQVDHFLTSKPVAHVEACGNVQPATCYLSEETSPPIKDQKNVSTQIHWHIEPEQVDVIAKELRCCSKVTKLLLFYFKNE